MLFANIVNSAGVSLILSAFFLLILGKIKPDNRWYLLMNLIGAGLACYGSWLIGAYPFVVLEGTWEVKYTYLRIIITFGLLTQAFNEDTARHFCSDPFTG